MDFLNQYQKYLQMINLEIGRIFEVNNMPQQSVFDAMHYGICGGGKRIRPVITAAVCDMLGGDISDAIKVGCAIECIHNYSLIHDDLPCMDNDDLRRGRETCHIKFGEDIALLAGDGLLNIAFELLSHMDRYTSLKAVDLLEIIRVLSDATGAKGMIGGQVIDLESENKTDISEDTLRLLHKLKTGELIRASAECGCLTAGLKSDNEKYSIISEYSKKLGLAFQIKDDILDVLGNQELLGKPVGSDAESNKNTFTTLLGIDAAQKELDKLTRDAKELLSGIDNSEFLINLADYLLTRNN